MDIDPLGLVFFIILAGVIVYAVAGVVRLALETLLDVEFNDDDDNGDIL